MTAGKVPHWNDYLAAAAATRFDASLGLLGDQVASHGGCIQAVGPGAALGAARANGIVDHYQPFDESTLAAALASCPATLIDVGSIRDPADLDPQDPSRPTTTRAQQVAAVDARVAAVLKAAPSGTDVVLASLADAGVTERLRLIAGTGPYFGAGTLQSSSTRQPGLVQLSDVTVTALDHLGIARPSRLGGAPLQFVPGDGNDQRSAAERLTGLLDLDQSSHEVHGLVEPFFYGFALLQLALYLIAAVLWRRRWGTSPQRRRLLVFTRRATTVAATVPVSTFLANLLPWWRFSVPLVSVVASVAIFATIISLLALLGPWRRRLFGPLAVVCAATMAVLAADVMTGSRLQLSSLLGLQPVVGGRFYGMGNVTFAVFATATLMLCIAVGNHLVTVRQPRMAAAAVAAIGIVRRHRRRVPVMGQRLRGPPALLPGCDPAGPGDPADQADLAPAGGHRRRDRAFLVLAEPAGLAPPGRVPFAPGQIRADRHRRRRLGRHRPQARPEHVTPVRQPSVAADPGRPRRVGLHPRPADVTGRGSTTSVLRTAVRLLRPGLIAVLVMWVIGFALNDSGHGDPRVGATLAFPLVIAIALKTLEDEMLAGPATTRASLRLR